MRILRRYAWNRKDEGERVRAKRKGEREARQTENKMVMI
jgi:hypothetical protein